MFSPSHNSSPCRALSKYVFDDSDDGGVPLEMPSTFQDACRKRNIQIPRVPLQGAASVSAATSAQMGSGDLMAPSLAAFFASARSSATTAANASNPALNPASINQGAQTFSSRTLQSHNFQRTASPGHQGDVERETAWSAPGPSRPRKRARNAIDAVHTPVPGTPTNTIASTPDEFSNKKRQVEQGHGLALQDSLIPRPTTPDWQPPK